MGARSLVAWRWKDTIAWLALGATLASCAIKGGAPTAHPPGTEPSPPASAPPTVVAAVMPGQAGHGVTASPPGSTVGDPGTAELVSRTHLIGDHGSELVGTVALPAGLVSRTHLIGDHGSELVSRTHLVGDAGSELVSRTHLVGDAGSEVISHNGGNIISNNGGNALPDGFVAFATRARYTEVALPGVQVALVDAAGAPVVQDGKPLETTTDANGHYAFDHVPADHNAVVKVVLGDAGHLLAIAPRGQGQRTVDLDLASTLTTGYVLDQYVKGQADPVGTLERLPPDVEAATRVKAQAALDGTTVALPDDLTDVHVDATVTSLRAADRGLDDQLEVVRKLLVLAGQADLGNGRPALSVALGKVAGLAVAPDGTPFIGTRGGRIWRLQGDGTLATAVGTGVVQELAPVEGLPGPGAVIGAVVAIDVDAHGRLLVAEAGRVVRLEADGRLHELWRSPAGLDLAGLAAGPADALDVVLAGRAGGAFQLVHLDGAGMAAAPVALDLTSERGSLGGLVRTSAGALVVRYTSKATGDNPRQVDPATGATTSLRGERTDVLGPGGARVPYRPTVPTPFGPVQDWALQAAGAADGDVYVATSIDQRVYRQHAGTWTAVAGGGGQDDRPAAIATDLALLRPVGLTAGADGTLYVADAEAGVVYAIDPGHHVAIVAGMTQAEAEAARLAREHLPSAPPSPAVAVPATSLSLVLRIVHADGAGRLYLAPGLVRVTADGQATAAAVPPRGADFADFAPAPDGSVDALVLPDEQVVHVAADGSQTPLPTLQAPDPVPLAPGMRRSAALARGPDGTLYVEIGAALYALAPGARAWTTLAAHAPDLGAVYDPRVGSGRLLPTAAMAVDGTGRCCIAMGDGVVRFNPRTGTFDALAGKGGRIFTGTTADDAIGQVTAPVFLPDGSLAFIDGEHRQVKRIPAALLDQGGPP